MKLTLALSLSLLAINIASAQQSETQLGAASQEPAAQPINVSTVSAQAQTPDADTGKVRVGFIKSFPDVSIQARFFGRSQNFNLDVDQNYGFSLGYANIQPDQFGYMFDLNYMDFKDKEFAENFSSFRLDGNAAYGFGQYVYGHGGLNLNKYMSKWFKENSKLGFGYQAGFGVKMLDKVALQASYVRSNNDMRTSGLQSGDADIIMSGAEVRLLATF